MMTIAAGQVWTYRAPPEIVNSRIIIGALLEFEAGRMLACCTVTGALQQRPDGSLEQVTIPFLPMTVEALGRTVVAHEGEGAVAEDFARHFADWHSDHRGLSYFTVPFEGTLDRMIARQMAEIVGSDEKA